jgi:hypothetical protein
MHVALRSLAMALWLLPGLLSFGWSAPVAAQSTVATVYVTRTGEKYHRTDCHYLRQSRRAITLDSAVADGYTPCRVCRPPVPERRGFLPAVSPTPAPAGTTGTAVRCSGRTRDGTRCLRNTRNASGRCWQHEPD